MVPTNQMYEMGQRPVVRGRCKLCFFRLTSCMGFQAKLGFSHEHGKTPSFLFFDLCLSSGLWVDAASASHGHNDLEQYRGQQRGCRNSDDPGGNNAHHGGALDQFFLVGFLESLAFGFVEYSTL